MLEHYGRENDDREGTEECDGRQGMRGSLDDRREIDCHDDDENRSPPRRHPGQSHGSGSVGPTVRVNYSL